MKRLLTYILIAIATATLLIVGTPYLTNAAQRLPVPEVLIPISRKAATNSVSLILRLSETSNGWNYPI
ncbi:MAG: hypothetical protein KME10_25175 [Plectolyngbya sp. WJT66-NPBG17]|nr:hypothetical protein [Plectolyngbya sp. WJT66-NPBG17]